ncbi:hypothetical protein GCM10029976_080330 [Kribbella albertanoniae]|uniref:Recombinase family protein n=1 Tax=Kribbella albertanoniae TaxID=1266829 RepID=A0A4R4P1M4_9ACTN|nr:recombinase family protein [Kribbella albertanoniae]TDC14510.1 recombinase family protein [Kribbella albertanoniae]
MGKAKSTRLVLGFSPWDDKVSLMLGGAKVRYLIYGRSSKDKKELEYSIKTQAREGTEFADRFSWSNTGIYLDNDISASRFASIKAIRGNYDEMLEVIESSGVDVLVMQDLSRSSRDLEFYAQLRKLCMLNGVFFWMIDGNIFDLRVTADRNSLSQQAVHAETWSDSIHDKTSSGLESQVLDGRPHSHVPYGYERFKNQKTGAFERQVFDMTEHVAIHKDGTKEVYTPYGIVREIFERFAAMAQQSEIVTDLNTRCIPSPGGKLWSRQTVVFIATSATYMGKRKSYGKAASDGQWEGIVDPVLFRDVQAIVKPASRRTHRKFGRKWIMSYASHCDHCGAWLMSKPRSKKESGKTRYGCSRKGCGKASVTAETFDSFIESCLVAWLARPEVFQKLVTHRRATDSNIAVYEQEIAKADLQLEENKALRLAGEMDGRDFTDMQKVLRARIEAAQKAIRRAAIPQVIVDLIGPDAAEQWEAIAELDTRREIIKMVCAPRLRSANKNPRMPLADRVVFGGLMQDLQDA